jgi:glycosyltransferase involved in cell wall biosynthesis
MKPPAKIRVLHLIDNLDLGGAQTAIFAFLEEFDRERFEVVLASMHANRRSLFFARAAELGIEVVSLSPRRWLPLYLFTLSLLILSRRFQVVHCHLYVSNWFGKPLAKLLGVPVIISHDHGYDRFRFDIPWIAALDAWANGFANRILVIANSIRRDLVAVERVPARKIVMMRNGLAPRELLPRPRRLRKTIGGAGRFVGWKRFDWFLKIAKQLVCLDSTYRFLIAGGGPEAESLRRLTQELGLAENVIWMGQLPALEKFFEEIDLFILTSEIEELPMILMESMYQGVPTATISINEARADLSGDILALDPNQSEKEWAQQIDQYFRNPERLWELGQKGRIRIEREFMATQRIRGIEQIYLEELAARQATVGR